jgi:hypothetical protein
MWSRPESSFAGLFASFSSASVWGPTRFGQELEIDGQNAEPENEREALCMAKPERLTKNLRTARRGAPGRERS